MRGPIWEQFRSAQVPSELAPRSVQLGAGPNLEQFRSAQVPSELAPRSVQLGAGPNLEQFRSAQVPSELAPRSVELGAVFPLGAIGSIGLRPAMASHKKKIIIIIMIYLTTHSTHFIYGYMTSDKW